MTNIFDTINNFIRNNEDSVQTYGEVLENNKTKQKESLIKRLCSSGEYQEYITNINSDKQRFIRENNASLTNLDNNWLCGNNIGREQEIPGIGKTIQIC